MLNFNHLIRCPCAGYCATGEALGHVFRPQERVSLCRDLDAGVAQEDRYLFFHRLAVALEPPAPRHGQGSRQVGLATKDYQASLEKLRKDAAEAALIRDLATDKTKREMYSRLHEHFSRLADEIEVAMKAKLSE